LSSCPSSNDWGLIQDPVCYYDRFPVKLRMTK
jgi:hypothetical protein